MLIFGTIPNIAANPIIELIIITITVFLARKYKKQFIDSINEPHKSKTFWRIIYLRSSNLQHFFAIKLIAIIADVETNDKIVS